MPLLVILVTFNITTRCLGSAFFCTICSYKGDHVAVYRPLKLLETYQININI
jgi:hypothetical protein